MNNRLGWLPTLLLATGWGANTPSFAAPPATVGMASEMASSRTERFDTLLNRIVGSEYPRIDEADMQAALQRLEGLLPANDEARALRLKSIACNELGWYAQPADTLFKTLDTIHERSKAIGEQQAEFHSELCRALLLEFVGRSEQALHAADRAIKLAEQMDSPRLDAVAHFNRGGIYSVAGQQAAALIDLEKASELLRNSGIKDIPADFQLETMIAYRRMGMHDKAILLANEFRHAARDPDGQYRRISDGVQVSYVYSEAGMPEDAWRELQSLPSPNASGLTSYERVYLLSARAHVLVALKRHADAIEEIRTFEQLGLANDYPIDHALLLTTRGQAHLALGRNQLALADYNRAKQLLTNNANPRYLWPVFIGRAHVRAALGQAKEALSDYARGAELQMQLQKNMGIEQEALRAMQRQVAARDQENQSLRREQHARDAELAALNHARQWQVMAIAAASLTILILGTLALQQFRRNKKLRHLNKIDSLTDAASRASILQHATQMSRLGNKASQPTSLIVFDIDHFKAINDCYGHPRGDDVLRQVVTSAKQHLRASDIIGRIGGEEFLISCENTTPEHATRIAERIRTGLHALHWPDNPELKVSASFGISAVWPHENQPAPGIERADRALYQAKRAGRDRIEVISQ